MKRCPTCKRSFDDDTLSFCLEDGTPLIADSPSRRDSQETLVAPLPSVPGSSTLPYNRPPGQAKIGARQIQIPIAHPYGPGTKQTKTWLWVVAILAVLFILVGVGVLIAVGLPALMRASNNDNRAQPTPTRPAKENPSPSPSSSEDEDDVPTDKDKVLAQLSKLEEDWERANVKGDKEALERILADEYRGDGKTKRQYIDGLDPIDDIQSWEIQDLTVEQNGDRATVRGRLTEETKTGSELYDFVDEYVWRDHRWQAVSAHSSSVK